MLTISRGNYEEIRRHGEEAYPSLSCGALIGHLDTETNNRRVTLVVRCNNVSNSPHIRFSIDLRELAQVRQIALNHREEIVGFYYSHTDYPALWSKTTLQESHWLGCSYVVTNVMNRRAESTRSFQLVGEREDDKRFLHEEIVMTDSY